MGRILAAGAARVEVNKVDHVAPGELPAVNQVDRLALVPLRMAKMRIGECIGEAIGDAPLKQYGDKGQISHVLSGDKVPDYLARIWLDRAARTRFALALLNGTKVRKRLVIDLDEDEIAVSDGTHGAD